MHLCDSPYAHTLLSLCCLSAASLLSICCLSVLQVPLNRGVSSSASVEVAAMKAAAHVFGLAMAGERLATACQWVENQVLRCAALLCLALYYNALYCTSLLRSVLFYSVLSCVDCWLRRCAAARVG
jgi:hypothetical protein